MHVVTPKRLKSEVSVVREEMQDHGFLDSEMEKVEVFLSHFGVNYGCCYGGTNVRIRIPAISLSQVFFVFCKHPYSSLRDTIRHEYGHALACTHPRLIRSLPFKRAFGAHYDADVASDYSPETHVTEFASQLPCEDFAETFMLFLHHDGQLPPNCDTPVIRRKWRFIRYLGMAVMRGQGSWTQKILC